MEATRGGKGTGLATRTFTWAEATGWTWTPIKGKVYAQKVTTYEQYAHLLPRAPQVLVIADEPQVTQAFTPSVAGAYVVYEVPGYYANGRSAWRKVTTDGNGKRRNVLCSKP